MPADDDVHLRLVQHVAHVQAPGDVGRRQSQGEDRLLGIGRWSFHVEQFFLDPVLRPAGFDGCGFIGLGKIVRHAVPVRKMTLTPLILQDCDRSNRLRNSRFEAPCFPLQRRTFWMRPYSLHKTLA